MPTVHTYIIKPDANFCKNHPELTQQANALATSYESGTEIIEDTRLKAIGGALWAALNIDDDFNAAKRKAGLSGTLAIVIESAQGEVINLPWETLYHPELGFLARETGFSLTRRMSEVQTTLPDTRAEPLRILLFTSLPDNLTEQGRLDIEAEQAAVQEVLNTAELDGRIELEMPDDGRLESFRAMLQDFQPHLVWMSGHGEFTYNIPTDTAWGSFVFEDQWGNAVNIRETELTQCFTGVPSLQAVILSACQSAKSHTDFPANGLAQTLHHAGVPHVIGMRETVYDVAATRFAKAFMAALVHDKHPMRIDQALQVARREITDPGFGQLRYQHSDPQRQTISYGQWCLPQQLSHSLDHALIDWSFTPTPRQRSHAYKETFQDIVMPERFIGRRKELRQWQNALRRNEVSELLIIGAGGMGKTALAGKLLQTLEKDGFEVYGLSLRDEHNWQHSIERMVSLLDKANIEIYQRELELATETKRPEGLFGRFKKPLTRIDEYRRAKSLLSLLLQQHNHKLAVLWDNLESKQDNSKHTITDPDLREWLRAAQELVPEGLRLLLTSRWQLPNWDSRPILPLGKPLYGDYLAFARRLNLPREFMSAPERQQKAWDTLGGNFRALEFFAHATGTMSQQDEDTFLKQLRQASDEIQVDMAIAKLWEQCTEEQQQVLNRMRAYTHPVDMDGIRKVTLPGIKQPEQKVKQLLAVSLLEYYEHPKLKAEYQLSPLVRDWLEQQTDIPQIEQYLEQIAARYMLELLDKKKKTDWEHRINTHQALHNSGLVEDSHQLVLDWIVEPLNRAGRYQELITEWLPPLLESEKEALRGEALGQYGKQYLHIGDFDTALQYLQQALQIQQEIDDKAGEGATLDNISQVYGARGDYDIALQYLKQALQIQQKIGNKVGEGATLSNISLIYDARGDFDTALQYLKQSLQIRQDIGDKAGEGTTLNNISQIYDARSDFDTALQYLKQALQIRQEIGDKAGEGTTLNNISLIYSTRGDFDTALQYLRQSLQIQQKIGNKDDEGAALNNVSQVYYARGDFDTALQYLKQALQIYQKIGNKYGEGIALNNISQIYDARGNFDTALQYLKQALQIQQKIGNKYIESTTLNNISQIYGTKGDYETALKYLKQALLIQQDIGDKKGEGTTLNNISQIYRARGDYDTELKYLKQALLIQQDIGDMAGLCTTLFNMGHIHWQNEEHQKAKSNWLTVYRLAKKMNLARVLEALENLAPQIGLEGGLAGWEALANQAKLQEDA